MIAKQKMKETVTEMELANIAVDVAKKKGGTSDRTGVGFRDTLGIAEAAPGFAPDACSGHEDDMKVVRMQDVSHMEGTHAERPPGIQQTQLDVLATVARETRVACAGSGGSETRREKKHEPKERESEQGQAQSTSLLTEKLSNEANHTPGQKAELPPNATSSFTPSMDTEEKQGEEEERQGCHEGGLYVGDRSTQADRWLRLERTGRDSEAEHSQSRPGPLQAVLTKRHIESEKDGENSRGEDRSKSGSRPSSHLRSQERGINVTLAFDSTMGYPGEGPPRVSRFNLRGEMQRVRPHCRESITCWEGRNM